MFFRSPHAVSLLACAVLHVGCAQHPDGALQELPQGGAPQDYSSKRWPGIDLDESGWLRVGIAESYPGRATESGEFRSFLAQAEIHGVKTVTIMASRAQLGPDDLRLLGLIPGLEKLTIVRSAMDEGRGMLIDNAALEACASIASLTELSLSAGAFDGTGVSHLCQLPRLTRLHITGPLNDEAAEQIAGIRRLRSLQLVDCAVTARGLRAMEACTGLRRMDLRGEFVTDELASCFPALQHLSYLRLQDTHLTDEGLRELTRCPHLVSLVIEGSAIRGRSLADLGMSESLRFLRIEASQIRPDALGRAQWPPGLESLSLAGNPLTGEALLSMVLPVGIRFLDVRGVTLLPEELTALEQRVPHVTWGASDDHLEPD